MKKIILSIDGMTCSACSSGLEKYLSKQNGIENVSVNLVMANASIEYDEKLLSLSQIEEFVKQAGFKSLGEFKEIKLETKNKKQKVLFIIYTILAIILMYISMGHMVNLPVISFLNPMTNSTNYMFSLLILTCLFIIYGFDILRNGYKNLIHKTPNMDTLVGIGVITSFLYSLYNMYLVLKGNHNQVMNLYFESSAIVIYFIKLGRYIDGISKNKTKEAIQKLVKITPNKAYIKINNTLKEVTLDEINKGDIVVSRPGEKIAVDGEVIFGNAHLDESFITGESKPSSKEVGSKVLAGSLNYDGYIEYKAERIGKDSTVSEIVKLVVEASNSKPQIARTADKVSSYFVPIVIIIAVLSFLIYLVIGQGITNALTTFVTILVIACPCSLGLATPLAVIVSEGKCASSGILIKKSEILENAQKVDTIVFDKTGTLTYGKLKIAKIFNYSSIQENDLMKLIGSIETKSTHPISKAFTDYLEKNNLAPIEVTDFKNHAGLGISGKVNNNSIVLGNSKILDEYKINNSHSSDEKILSENGNSIIYAIKDNEIIALIGVNDIIRENSKIAIEKFNQNKIETIMLTGDNEKTAQRIAEEVGISKVISNVLPAEKASTIKKLKEENKFILMCGDRNK